MYKYMQTIDFLQIAGTVKTHKNNFNTSQN